MVSPRATTRCYTYTYDISPSRSHTAVFCNYKTAMQSCHACHQKGQAG